MQPASTTLAGGDATIVAIATAAGRGAVALVRLSGARAIDIARALGVSSRHETIAAATPRRATRVRLVHPITHAPLDDALVTVFPGPRSYTGEDVVEFSTHGGQVVPAAVLAACISAGARLAFPGEFTRRAVLNGRLDLVQAEAVADLIDARTAGMHQQALSQLDGGLSQRLLALRQDVIHLEALLAYDLDFPEEDDGPIAPARIPAAATALARALRALLDTAPRGAVLRDGLLVVIAGPPNAGKSSLFNALLGEARALVTPVAGTTRDAIEAVLDVAPVPLRLVDTAGLRETDDPIEQLGIEVSSRYLARAALVIACGATVGEVIATHDALQQLDPDSAARTVSVLSKRDLAMKELVPDGWVGVSSTSGAGVGALLDTLSTRAAASLHRAAAGEHTVDVLVTRARHVAGLSGAAAELDAFHEGWTSGHLPAPVAAVHLHSAREALSDLIGIVDTEDVLDRVFRDFCIGK